MEELKPCPQEAEALDIIESLLDVADMKCTGPLYADAPPRSGMCRIPEDDAIKLRQYIADRRAAPENHIADADKMVAPGNLCADCSGIVYRQTASGKIIPVDQRCGAKITPPCYQPDSDGCAYQIYGDNNDEPIDRCKACPLCYADKVRHTAPENKPLTLDELRGMDGEPVWIVEAPDWGHWELSERAEDYLDDRDPDFYGMKHDDPAGRYGLHVLGWLAFARRPEGSAPKAK